MADLKTTWGRPVRACLRKAWLRQRARAANSPSATTTSTPSSRRMPRPRPEAFSVGSSEPTTTRARPASMIASVHGGVWPWWQQGSSETYSVAPRRSASPHASSAARSACAAPYAACQPSPSVSPSRQTTAPTSGLGLVRPRPCSASSMARASGAWSVCSSVVTWDAGYSPAATCSAAEPVDHDLGARALERERVGIERKVEGEAAHGLARGVDDASAAAQGGVVAQRLRDRPGLGERAPELRRARQHPAVALVGVLAHELGEQGPLVVLELDDRPAAPGARR